MEGSLPSGRHPADILVSVIARRKIIILISIVKQSSLTPTSNLIAPHVKEREGMKKTEVNYIWSDTVNTNCCLNPSLARLVDSAHYKQQTRSLQITRVHQKVCFFSNFCFCQSNLVQKITKISTNTLKYSNSLYACLEINNQRKKLLQTQKKNVFRSLMYKSSRQEGAAHTERGHEELSTGKESAANCRTQENKSCFEAVIATYEGNPQKLQGHCACVTVLKQEASHQPLKTLDKALGLTGV